jgi:hypothetical protein
MSKVPTARGRRYPRRTLTSRGVSLGLGLALTCLLGSYWLVRTETSRPSGDVTVGKHAEQDREPSTRWARIADVNLSRDRGWEFTTGVRGTDRSYNREEQVRFDSTGMSITAQRARAGATIYSADARAEAVHLPDHFAIEADVTLTGLGSGMFPAFWFRPVDGDGELDAWEYCGAFAGTSLEMKSTVIKTGPVGDTYNRGFIEVGIPRSAADGGRFEGRHRWRYEKTTRAVTLFLDGTRVGSITKAELDAAAGRGSWNAQFEAGQEWYPRFTWQVGDGADSRLAGPIPPRWRKSTMLVSRLVAYRERSE